MSVDAENPSGEPDIISDEKPDQDKSKASGKDTVSHDTYKKTVGEVKRLKEQLKEALTLKDKLAELEQNEQMRQGKHEETITTLRKQLEDTKKSEKAVFQKYAFKSLGEQVRVEAMKHGCVDPDALMKLADLSDVEIDAETFEADKDKLAEIVASVKTTKPYLFNKSGPKINGKMPSGEKVESKGIDFKKMTAGEITDWLNKNR
jgi:Asp-tRNA(Asn)/Glu-tRNA(Gln) amidotransferase C subunit